VQRRRGLHGDARFPARRGSGAGRSGGTARISVNGELVGTQVDDERRWDVTDHLRTGTNTFEVDVRTTLRNAVTRYNRNSTVTQPYGLRGPVRLDPCDSVLVYDPEG